MYWTYCIPNDKFYDKEEEVLIFVRRVTKESAVHTQSIDKTIFKIK